MDGSDYQLVPHVIGTLNFRSLNTYIYFNYHRSALARVPALVYVASFVAIVPLAHARACRKNIHFTNVQSVYEPAIRVLLASLLFSNIIMGT